MWSVPAQTGRRRRLADAALAAALAVASLAAVAVEHASDRQNPSSVTVSVLADGGPLGDSDPNGDTGWG
jgi:hypothetical protein